MHEQMQKNEMTMAATGMVNTLIEILNLGKICEMGYSE